MNVPWELLDSYFDGEASPEHIEQLAAWLRSDPANRRLLVLEAHFRQGLRTELQTDAAVSGASTLPFPSITARRDHGVRFSMASFAVAASVAILLSFAAWYFRPPMGLPEMSATEGRVRLKRYDREFPVRIGTQLESEDILTTDEASSASIGFSKENTALTLGPGSLLRVISLDSGKHLELRTGRLDAEVARQRPFKTMVVRTPNAVASVVGTRFFMTTTNSRTELSVSEGTVQLRDTVTGTQVAVSAGHYAMVAPATEMAALPHTGKLSRQWWNGASWWSIADAIDHPGFPDHPDGHDLAPNFEVEPMKTNRFGMRLVGYLHPPVTDDYTLSIASAGSSALFLSPDDRASEKQLVALGSGDNSRRGWDDPREPGEGSNPHFGPVQLKAGRRYYIEAIVAVLGEQELHFSAAWQRPGTQKELISGQFLSPLEGSK